MLAKGLIAGAAGTMALDMYTNADILARGRAPSELPSKVAQKLAERVGLTTFAHDDSEAAKNRRSGAGALFGYEVGLGTAVVYAFVQPKIQDWLPWPVAGVILGAATLVMSEGSATALGATDWSTWSASDWMSDILPRTLYGLTTAWVVDNISDAW